MVLFGLPLGMVLVLAAPPAISTVAGTGRAGDSGDGGPAARALLNQPFDVVFDAAGNLYLADTGNHRIRRVDARSGTITTVAGDGTKGFAGDGGAGHASAVERALRRGARRPGKPLLRRPPQPPGAPGRRRLGPDHHDRGRWVENVLG